MLFVLIHKITFTLDIVAFSEVYTDFTEGVGEQEDRELSNKI